MKFVQKRITVEPERLDGYPFFSVSKRPGYDDINIIEHKGG